MSKLTVSSLNETVVAFQAQIIALQAEVATLRASRPIYTRSAPVESYAERKARLAAFYAEHFPGAKCVSSDELRAAGWVQ